MLIGCAGRSRIRVISDCLAKQNRDFHGRAGTLCAARQAFYGTVKRVIKTGMAAALSREKPVYITASRRVGLTAVSKRPTEKNPSL